MGRVEWGQRFLARGQIFGAGGAIIQNENRGKRRKEREEKRRKEGGKKAEKKGKRGNCRTNF